MKAITRQKYGGPDILSIKNLDIPVPGAHEVLVKVYATTVNRTDCAILSGKPFIMRLFTGLFTPKAIPGTDFAGVIEAVGSRVTLYKPGDRVWGFNDTGLGSYAQYITLSENEAIETITGGCTYDQAAASAEGAHYAYNFINKVKLVAAQKVLVNGATGAIGSALVQMLKSMGIYVTATAATKNLELVTSLGADKVIDYTTEDFTKDTEKYDCVFDAVGKSTFARCKPLLTPRGIYISSELGPWVQNPFLALITPLFGGKKVVFPVPKNIKGSLRFIKKLIEQGSFKPVIERTYTMEEIGEAWQRAASGQKTGNLVVHFNN